MAYEITWTAMSAELGETTGTEIIEAANALDALNTARSPIIGKLTESGQFIILNINIKTTDGTPVTVNVQAIYGFLNSLNSEGGLVKYENPPDTFTIRFGEEPPEGSSN